MRPEDIKKACQNAVKPGQKLRFHCSQCGDCCRNREDIILTPYDLLYYLPRAYRDYRDPQPVAETAAEEQAVVCVTITQKRRPVFARGGTTHYFLESVDSEGTPLGILIFNNMYSYQNLQVGRTQ